MFKFESLQVWEDSTLLVKKVYILTNTFPREELFSLTDQIKRATISITANIAEGSGSSSKKDFAHFLDISIKSAYEVVSHLYLAKEMGYISEKQRVELYKEIEVLVKKMKSFKSWLAKIN